MVVEKIERQLKKNAKMLRWFSAVFIIIGLLFSIGLFTLNIEGENFWALLAMSAFCIIFGSIQFRQSLQENPIPELILNKRTSIVWMYMLIKKKSGSATGNQEIIISTVDGKQYSIPGGVEATNEIFEDLIKLMPDVNVGYAVEKKHLYNNNPAEFSRAVKMMEK